MISRIAKSFSGVLKGRTKKTPRVSVIVPVYNVQEYLERCVRSITTQTYKNIEIICVDDGSKDNSPRILKEARKHDNRIRIITQVNQGLGAARNTGIRHSAGDFLMFVDSDDALAPNAISALLDTLQASGSDFSVGAFSRDTDSGRSQPLWIRQLHDRNRLSLSLSDEPDVLKHVFAWGKLFRRQFFLDVVKAYPDGLYEDQVPSLAAFAEGRFDLISDNVYFWRLRGDGSSITQQKGSIEDLQERIRVFWNLINASKIYDPLVQELVLRKIIGFDLRVYLEVVPTASDDFWSIIQSFVESVLDYAGYAILGEIDVSDRLIVAAAYRGFRHDVVELLIRREQLTWKVPGKVRNGVPVIRNLYFDGLSLKPDGVVEKLNVERDIKIEQIIDFAGIVDDSLLISGIAYFRNLTHTEDRTDFSLVAISEQESDQDVAKTLKFGREYCTVEATDRGDIAATDPWNHHLFSSFSFKVPLHDFQPDDWKIWIHINSGGIEKSGLLSSPQSSNAPQLTSFSAQRRSHRYFLSFKDGVTLKCHDRSTEGQHQVLSAWSNGVDFFCKLDTKVCLTPLSFIAVSNRGQVVHGTLAAGDHESIVSFPIPFPTSERSDWKLYSLASSSKRRLLWAGEKPRCFDGCEPYLIRFDEHGGIIVFTGPVTGEITEVEVSSGMIRLKGWSCASDEVYASGMDVLLYNRAATSGACVRLPYRGSFEVNLPLVDDYGIQLDGSRGFGVVFRTPQFPDYWPRVSLALVSSMPFEKDGGAFRLRCSVTQGGALWIRLGNAFSGLERSRRGQRILQTAYHSRGTKRDFVLFESFGGKVVGDSPLAISKELRRRESPLRQFWSVSSKSTPVPDWASPLLRFSERWYDVLRSSAVLVNNANWPWFFDKAPYQIYLQTWHGTPFKKIANDIDNSSLSLSYRSLMEREVAAWDLLLAQNDFATETLRSAFGYRGEILNVGYPRNDCLVSDEAKDIRQRTRSVLGFSDEDVLVLYAPTWRDNVKGNGGYGRVSYMDYDIIATSLGPRYKVLFRGHSNTFGSGSELPQNVLDVTRYGDVNDLILASDLLVTDYSSIFFDYAVTRKPIYFLVPDLEFFTGRLRGSYFELREIAPGPILRNTRDLVKAIQSFGCSDYPSRIEGFLDRFAPRDDGKASVRVVDALQDMMNKVNK